MLTSDSSDPAAKAASTDSVGSTHSDPRTYSDSASRRIMPSLQQRRCPRTPAQPRPSLHQGPGDPAGPRDCVWDAFIFQADAPVGLCVPPRWLSREVGGAAGRPPSRGRAPRDGIGGGRPPRWLRPGDKVGEVVGMKVAVVPDPIAGTPMVVPMGRHQLERRAVTLGRTLVSPAGA